MFFALSSVAFHSKSHLFSPLAEEITLVVSNQCENPESIFLIYFGEMFMSNLKF